MPELDLLLVRLGERVARAVNREELQNALARYRFLPVDASELSHSGNLQAPGLVLLDDALAPAAERVIEQCRGFWPSAPVVGMVDAGEPAARVLPLLDAGLEDFLWHPIRDLELRVRIERLLPSAAAPGPTEEWKRSLNLETLVGSSKPFWEALRRIPLLAGTDATVLIYGETGTGKELFARALHYCSPRKSGPFVPVNCGALPEHLLENELFGHARGAYTDAGSSEKGLLAMAEGGTLLLDEVDGLAPRAQVKLLRFLQDREYRPLGSNRSIIADVRILAAANRDLRKLVETGHVREDLYHRLNILRIQIPPLRERKDDIPLLAQRFVSRYRAEFRRPAVKLSPAVLAVLMRYHWPGNVRELEGVIQRAVVLADETAVQPADLDLPVFPEVREADSSSFQAAKARAIEDFERAYLTELLRRFEGNVSRAADAAGKERRSFQRLLQKHGVSGTQFREAAAKAN